MRTLSLLATSALLCASLPSFGLTHSHHAHASIRHSVLKSHKGHASVRHESAVLMDSERATQIQTALIKSGYLSGEPTGAWDAQTVSAMQKLQGDNGWQTKITPDSRALIKLGLGPQQDAQVAPAATPGTPVETSSLQ